MSTHSTPRPGAVPDVDVEAAVGARPSSAGDASTSGSSADDGRAFVRRGSGASTSGLRILMKDLSYHVASNTKKGERAHLLQNVSAYLEPGQMTALMGPSGSGKTTLLDLLAGRKTVGKTEGTLLFGGTKPTKQFLRRYTGYVEQFDTLLGDLTVREMLLYTAELKRPVSEPLDDKRHEVDTLLQRLALGPCADVKIGDPMSKGISGGQAKRTNIGIALITNPRVLFLDEPTSGLDSYTANEVMKVVRALASDGTTIVATIHSPSAATFALFDRVMLLVRGQMAYFGPQGVPALEFAAAEWPAAKGASQLLELHRTAATATAEEREGSEAAIAPAFNDAELIVDTVTEMDQRGEAAALAATYAKSALAKANEAQLDFYLADAAAGRGSPGNGKHCVPCRVVAALKGQRSGMRPSAVTSAADEEAPAPAAEPSTAAVAAPSPLPSSVSDEVARELATRSETVTPWWWGLLTLIKYRSTRNYLNPAWLGPRIADKLLVSLIMLTLYWGIGDNLAPDNLINIQSALFMWALLPAFGAASYVPAIVLERRLFIRERADGLYKVYTYLAFKLLEELLLSIVITLIFASYVFYGIQLRGDWVVFWLVYFVDLSVGIVLAYLVAALSPNMDVANAALPAFVVTLLFFAGQLMTISSIPVYWQWYSRIDFLRYAWGALMINQFGENNVELAGGVSILSYYSLEGVDKWAYVGYLAIFWFVFAVLALLALTYVRHHKR